MSIIRVSRPSPMLVTLFSGLFAELAGSFFAIALSLAASALLMAGSVAATTVTYEMVTVGDAGNAADTTGYGAVAYEYQIGTYDVTIGQYAEFLNAVAATDTYSLYNPSMATDLNIAGIQQNGTSGSYSYSLIGPSGTTPAGANSPGNRPITYVSWFDAARFANWMQNGQGSGSTETGAYTLNGATSGDAPVLNVGATFSIPTENEWYKAAFYKGGGTEAGYWTYATQSDSVPGNAIGSGANLVNYTEYDGVGTSVTQSLYYNPAQNYLTDVGAFSGSSSGYGTFDQTGNVWQWNDLDGTPGDQRGIRGGGWASDTPELSSSYTMTDSASYESATFGFRLAGGERSIAAIPEIDPNSVGSVLAVVLGSLGLLERRRPRGPMTSTLRA